MGHRSKRWPSIAAHADPPIQAPGASAPEPWSLHAKANPSLPPAGLPAPVVVEALAVGHHLLGRAADPLAIHQVLRQSRAGQGSKEGRKREQGGRRAGPQQGQQLHAGDSKWAPKPACHLNHTPSIGRATSSRQRPELQCRQARLPTLLRPAPPAGTGDLLVSCNAQAVPSSSRKPRTCPFAVRQPSRPTLKYVGPGGSARLRTKSPPGVAWCSCTGSQSEKEPQTDTLCPPSAAGHLKHVTTSPSSAGSGRGGARAEAGAAALGAAAVEAAAGAP